MSADNRTVATDALATLGTIIDDTAKRDAIHLAVIPVIAGNNMRPGEHVGLDSEGLATTFRDDGKLGIVDPFLERPVQPGERFWLVIYPRVITSLRHVWTHPALPDEVPATTPKDKDESRLFLENYARGLFSCAPDEHLGSRFDLLIRCAEEGYFPTDIEGPGREPTSEFWMHYERFTGKKVENKTDWFSCAC